ncbi:uncharacterized protein LOC119672808 [Teleopsis dalmanni]|uniref:uncharacterized protein LOC119672808 n=1 Tax=Teleopsis dalmanni TaxID=139649 RepID=UPI0018CD5D64|nr:uncharacterized protein LOC119672808 [Teleopsis dalmanni]
MDFDIGAPAKFHYPLDMHQNVPSELVLLAFFVLFFCSLALILFFVKLWYTRRNERRRLPFLLNHHIFQNLHQRHSTFGAQTLTTDPYPVYRFNEYASTVLDEEPSIEEHEITYNLGTDISIKTTSEDEISPLDMAYGELEDIAIMNDENSLIPDETLTEKDNIHTSSEEATSC